uniref:Uncharacterized protein n=1 Tax=Anguilla anguilla TaxID=7936 RepID=A0A0E9PXU3_ANGAN
MQRAIGFPRLALSDPFSITQTTLQEKISRTEAPSSGLCAGNAFHSFPPKFKHNKSNRK